ncbi:MAG: hypothetical protein DWQ05_05890 [Calditrichaeota bacterium]|nr:MAG: hypothetical protein DWQ05_05890 [Calditrichota bacterium]
MMWKLKQPRIIVFITGLLLAYSAAVAGPENGKITCSEDGFVEIDGNKKFLIGTYHLPQSESPYRTLSKNGFNLVRVELQQSALKSAHENKLWVWTSIGHIADNFSAAESNAFIEKIHEWKDEPGLLFWELEDEPAYTWGSAKPRIEPAALIRTYNLVKKEDPDHLIYMNHAPVNLVSTLQDYNAAADILACDVYPVIPHGIRPSYALFDDGLQGDLLNTSLSQVGEYADKMKRVSADKPLFLILQGFAWEMLRKAGDRDSAMILYPNYYQLRFMAFNAIIHGVNGLLFWGTKYTPANADFWPDLFKLTGELSSLNAVLTAPAVDNFVEIEYQEMGHSVDAGIEILTKAVGNKIYLITANADRNPVKIKMRGLGRFNTMSSVSGGEKIEFHNGTHIVNYKPFEVHLFIVEHKI